MENSRLDQVTHILKSRGCNISSHDRLRMAQTLEVNDSIEREIRVNKQPVKDNWEKPWYITLGLCVVAVWLVLTFMK